MIAWLPLALLSFVLIWGSAALAGTTAYRNVVLGDAPIVYYEFDETSGTTAANSATTKMGSGREMGHPLGFSPSPSKPL